MNENTYHIGSRWIININHHSVDKCGLWQDIWMLVRWTASWILLHAAVQKSALLCDCFNVEYASNVHIQGRKPMCSQKAMTCNFQ